MVLSKTVHGALKETLQMNFSQINCWMSSKALTLNPASFQSSASFSTRLLSPPSISPSRISSIPLW